MSFFDNIVIFRFYLVIAIIFLIPICFFITNELFNGFLYYTTLARCVNRTRILNLDPNNILVLFQFYLKKQKWLNCILMLESCKKLEKIGCYNLLGICYQKIDCYIIAQYYYLRAINNDPKNLTILQNLASLYKLIGKSDDLKNLCNRILSLDPNNIIANKYLSN